MDDLIKFVTKIKAGGNKIVLPADINERVVEGKMSRALKQIALTKAFYRRFKTAGPASCDRGSMKIEGVWSTDEMLPTCVSLLSHVFGTGEHRVILVDFDINGFLGSRMKTCSPSMMRLTLKNRSAVEKHNLRALELCQLHNTKQSLDTVESS